MAFDGVTIANIVYELNQELAGSRLYKIAQPEEDELLLTFKTKDGQKKLFLSADASLPLIYLTAESKPSPMTAPNFCMLLRKHLQNARVIAIRQPGLERIVQMELEHLDEMGDLCRKELIIEIMGKHSNIIFCNSDHMIIDSIKHISAAVSSVREVLPGRPYFVANTQEKAEILCCDYDSFVQILTGKAQSLYKAIYNSFTGISPVLAQELCFEAGVDSDLPTTVIEQTDFRSLYRAVNTLTDRITQGNFTPCIAYEGGRPIEFAAVPLTIYPEAALTPYESMSVLLETYYAQKNAVSRIRQKSADLRRIAQMLLERDVKKYDLQMKQMEDTAKRDTYRIYGELLNTYGYDAKPGARALEALNYYTNEMITIPLDPTLSATENAKRYFDKYGKLKRTFEALEELTVQVKAEIDHLETILSALDIAIREEDLVEIKEEMTQCGYIRRKGPVSAKKVKVTSRPFHYVSSDGYDIYVGKNNFQNDELTFRFATGNDWWFHAKGMPGSHVVVKSKGPEELPDSTFEEAGRLAAYYSKGREQEKVEIDYIQKKHVKKPNGAKPGFVVYYTNYSLMISPDISGITQLD
ncbi:MAG: NFACT RNA binding domain-containing protein [Acetatifactor sp.]|nr:NFACT RNA binding domain-containing protein [Acetatifactor sp.]